MLDKPSSFNLLSPKLLSFSERDGARIERVRQAARDYEAIVLSQFLSIMFEGIPTDGLTGGGTGEDVFRGLLIEEYGKQIAFSAYGIGIAEAITEQFLKRLGTDGGDQELSAAHIDAYTRRLQESNNGTKYNIPG